MTKSAVATKAPAEILEKVAITPMSMLQIAVEQGADLDKLEKLMELQERWEANEARKAFIGAKAGFKSEDINIYKTRKVDFESRGGGTSYHHATLDNVADIISPALGKHGLSYSWKTEQPDSGVVRVTCVLTHILGHSEEVTLQAQPDQTGNKNNIQAVGSTVTYLERYTLLAATGMATADQDTDALITVEGGGDAKPERTDVSRLSTTPMPPVAEDDLDKQYDATMEEGYVGEGLGLKPVQDVRPEKETLKHSEEVMSLYGRLWRASEKKETPVSMQKWRTHKKVIEGMDELPKDLRGAIDENIEQRIRLWDEMNPDYLQ